MTGIELTLLGLLGGLLFSIAFWWYQTHILIPKLAFSEQILKTPDDPPPTALYRVKIQNTGRHRKVIDISLYARIYLPHYHLRSHGAEETSTIISIPLNTDRIFALAPGANRHLRLDVDRIDIAILSHLDDDLQQRVTTREDGALEALLSLRTDGYLQIQALAFDAFSGARKHYSSKEYRSADILRGVFDGMRVNSVGAQDEQIDTPTEELSK